MSNELTPVSASPEDAMNSLMAMPEAKYADDAAFNQVSSAGYLPRLMLMNAMSKLVQTNAARAGTYVIQQNSTSGEDLTNEVNVMPVKWRPKAMDLSNEKKIISAYNHKSDLFRQISGRAETPNSNCLYGPEFLIWIPSINRWATYYMASKTARRAAAEFKNRLDNKQNVTLKSTFIRSGSNSWWGPVVVTCSMPLQGPEDLDEAREIVMKFTSPPESETEAESESLPEGVAPRAR